MRSAYMDADILDVVVTHCDRFLTDPELQQATFRRNGAGDLMRWSGGRAVVFCADLAQGGSKAVRFLRESGAETQVRYETIERFITASPTVPLVSTRWLSEGATSPDGTLHPLITMDWVEGLPLDLFTDSIVDKDTAAATFGSLAAAWLDATQALRTVDIAHGDVHAGNILVGKSPRATSKPATKMDLTLVDYDCIWVPGLNVGSNEVGRPAFQFPGAERPWGSEMDAFPNSLVYLSLIGLAADTSLWGFHEADDHLIFHQDDLLEPSNSPVFQALSRSGDPKVRDLAEMVVDWIGQSVDRYESLGTLIAQLGEPRTMQNVWGAKTPPAEAAEGVQVWKPLAPPGAGPITPPGQPPPPRRPGAQPPAPRRPGAQPAAPRRRQPPPPTSQEWTQAPTPGEADAQNAADPSPLPAPVPSEWIETITGLLQNVPELVKKVPRGVWITIAILVVAVLLAL